MLISSWNMAYGAFISGAQNIKNGDMTIWWIFIVMILLCWTCCALPQSIGLHISLLNCFMLPFSFSTVHVRLPRDSHVHSPQEGRDAFQVATRSPCKGLPGANNLSFTTEIKPERVPSPRNDNPAITSLNWESENVSTRDIPTTHAWSHVNKLMPAIQVLGTAKCFNIHYGYGFINSIGTKEDVFVYWKVIKINTFRKFLCSIGDGESMEFDVTEWERPLQVGQTRQCRREWKTMGSVQDADAYHLLTKVLCARTSTPNLSSLSRSLMG